MISASTLRFADEPPLGEDEAAPPAAGGPQVFVRTLTAPPGWPWEQRRNVELEARHGAPLPIGELIYRVRRLEPWRSGSGSRFAVFYVLAREVQGELEATADVDGRPLKVTFTTALGLSGAAALRFAKGLVVAGAAVLVVSALGAAIARRSETGARLDLVEQRSAARLRAAETRDRVRQQARLLDGVLDRGAALSDVAADLAWASNAKRPDLRVEALHWERGLMAVEVRGDAPPFEAAGDRRVQRGPRPVRPGVWLWAVAPQAAAPDGEAR